MDLKDLPVTQRVNALVKALDGAKRTNEALARCSDGEQMLDVLLTRWELQNTPPIRDWIWWKNKEAPLTIGDSKPRYQQDGGQGKPSPAASEQDDPPRRRFLGLF